MTGLSLVLDVAGPPGGVTVTETPTYPGALRILSQRKRRVRGWAAGPDGWDPGYLARLIRPGPPGVLYVQPDGHNPTGATMPPATRETLGRTAAAAAWLVVTDETMRPLHLAESHNRIPGRNRPPRHRRLVAEQDRMGRAAPGLDPRPGRHHPAAEERRRRHRRGPERPRPDHHRPAPAGPGCDHRSPHPAAHRKPEAPGTPPQQHRAPLAPPHRRGYPVARPPSPLLPRGGAGLRAARRAAGTRLHLRRRRTRRPAPADPLHRPARDPRPRRRRPQPGARGPARQHEALTAAATAAPHAPAGPRPRRPSARAARRTRPAPPRRRAPAAPAPPPAPGPGQGPATQPPG